MINNMPKFTVNKSGKEDGSKMKKTIVLVISLFLVSLVGIAAVFAIDENDPNGDIPTQDEIKQVVFLSDSGSDQNSGIKDTSPVASFSKAFDLLKEEGGIIVVCGRATLPESTFLPSCDKDIELTSYYEGLDYKSSNGAEIFYNDTLNIQSSGKIHFYGIKLHSQKKASIYCNGTDVQFGVRIENESDDRSYPSIYGGRALDGTNTESDGSFSDFTVTVDSGYYHSITLGNNRTTPTAPISSIKDSALKINGGSFLATDADDFTTSAVSAAYPQGKIYMEINGGMFYGSVYTIGNEGNILPFVELKYNSDITVKITNGTFLGKYIKALYNPSATLDGKYEFISEGGSYSNLIYVGCQGVKGDISLTSCEAIQNKLYGFEKVIFLSKNGDDNLSGENEKTAKKTFSGAFAALRSGGTIVLCSDYSIDNGFTTRTTDQKIRITSRYFDKNYAELNGAALNISGNINLKSDISFDNITIKTDSSATFSCYGSYIEFGDNLKTDGDIAISLKARDSSHTFCMSSGSFSIFDFESSNTSTYISIKGGTIDLFRGCSNMHVGDIFVDFSGGIINGDIINISPNGVSGNVQLIVGNAQIKANIATQRPDTDKLCEALVVYEYDKTKLIGFDIIEDNYVFVKDGATGNGSTPSLAAPTLEQALAYIGNSNACVVFCGKTTYKDDYTPKNVGIITYSSIYRNIDFSSISDAKLILEKDYYFDNDATLENIKVISNRPGLSIHCNSHIVIFGYGIVCEIPYVNNSYYLSIIANDSIPSSPYNDKLESLSDKITIKSGIWNNIHGSASTEFFGGVVKGSVYGTKDLSVDSTVTVWNGIIYGGIYGAESVKENSTSNITLSFAGGEIHGVISPSYSASTGYTGKYLINISGGDFSGIDKIEKATFIGGEKSYANVKDDIDMTAYSESYITYQNPISSEISGITYLNGRWYLAKASGSTITLYSSNTINALANTSPIYTADMKKNISELSVSCVDDKLYIFARTVSGALPSTEILMSETLEENTASFTIFSGEDASNYISPAIYTYNGEKYLYYALESDAGSDIYCAKIDTALNLLSDPVKILSAGKKWEAGYLTSPRMITTPKGDMYIAFTGGMVHGGTSMIGMAKIISSDLLNPSSYKKDPDPVFYETQEFKNLVLSSVIQISGASEPYLVFSSRLNGQYCLILQSFSFDSENTPYLSTPSKTDMLYLAYYMPRTLTTLLEGFDINVAPDVNIGGQLDEKFSIVKFITENAVIVATSCLVVMFVIILMIIKKCTQSPQAQFKKNQKEHSRKERRRASRLNVGRKYAANLQKFSEEEETVGNVSEVDAEENIDISDEETAYVTEKESECFVKDIQELASDDIESDTVSVDDVTPTVNTVDIIENEQEVASGDCEVDLKQNSVVLEDTPPSEVKTASVEFDTVSESNSTAKKRPRPSRRI